MRPNSTRAGALRGRRMRPPQRGCPEDPGSEAMNPIGCASRSLQGDIRATEPGLQAGGSFPQLDPSTPLRFAQDDEAIVLVEAGAEGLPVARF